MSAAGSSVDGSGIRASGDSTWIKICGVRDPRVAKTAAEAGADAIGLMFVARSPRHITLSQAADIIEVLPEHVEPVGVFSNSPVAEIRHAAESLGLHTVQLHGDEPVEAVIQLQPLRVIKAFGFDLDHLTHWLTAWKPLPARLLQGLLVDAPAGTGPLRGGTGRCPDWNAIARVRNQLSHLAPLILAGGLSPSNIGEALKVIRPDGVDVSSGVESSPGVKQIGQIIDFCKRVRAADAGQE